jgi:hypothetical protein
LIQIGAKGKVQPLAISLRDQVPGVDQKDGQKSGINVPGVPEGDGQLVVDLDLGGEIPDVTKPDAELIVPGAILRVVRTDLLVSERFHLRDRLLESHGHVSIAP